MNATNISFGLLNVVLFTILLLRWMQKLKHKPPGWDRKGCAHHAD
jgi:hypothetical protein